MSTPACPNAPPPPRRFVAASARVDALFRRDASDAVRSTFDSRRFATPPSRAYRPPERRPSRFPTARRSHRARAVPTARWIRGDADGRRRRRVVDARRRGRDSKIRRLARVSKRGIGRRDAQNAETRDGGGVARARGARTRARRRGAARRIKIKRRRATRVEDERDRTTEGGRMRLARDDEEIGLTR